MLAFGRTLIYVVEIEIEIEIRLLFLPVMLNYAGEAGEAGDCR